jgi:tetratricopeptide (TPR) repeat protein
MGFFDRLFGRQPTATPKPLRERLFETVHVGDDAALARLCAEHEAEILARFPEWRTVPEEARSNPASVQRYGQALVGIAQHFARTRNRPELLQQLMGTPATNPITRWQESMKRARELMGQLDFEGALAVLTPELERVRALSGEDAGPIQAMTLGQLAMCHFQQGRAGAALPLFQEALALCRTAGDAEGIAAYQGSLFEVHRYLGQGPEAAEAANAYATQLERAGQAAQARRYRTLAGIVQRGEPLNRVVVELEGETLELDELPSRLEGSLRFNFWRNRISLERAMVLVRKGGELGSQGRFEEALRCFQEAGRADPHAPEPVYEEAFTLLHLQRASEAVACYDRAEALAPGWYHCRSDRWLAAEIAAGRVPHAAFALLHSLEEPGLDAAELARRARLGVQAAPTVASFHLTLSQALAALGQEGEAREVLAEGLRQAQEPDIRSRLRVEAARRDSHAPESQRMLREALAPGGNLVAAAMASIMLRTAPGLLN